MNMFENIISIYSINTANWTLQNTFLFMTGLIMHECFQFIRETFLKKKKVPTFGGISIAAIKHLVFKYTKYISAQNPSNVPTEEIF